MSDQAPVRRRGRKAETDEARAARIAGRVVGSDVTLLTGDGEDLGNHLKPLQPDGL